MKFIDEIKINVKAGKGGDGIISFRREYQVERGGPDGGDGGHGGSIYFLGDSGLNTLVHLRYKKNIIGHNGENGKRKNMYGSKGKDVIIHIPLGTVVYQEDNIIADIKKPKKYLIAKGGKGGRGNTKFKTAHNTAPKLSEKGMPGEIFNLKLILKVIADVGFVGKPSAGKSTLLLKITNAKPKIANYPFTTLNPQLGMVQIDNDNAFVVADLPGLIKGAAQGKGLGHKFLQHTDRCKIIAHIIDFGTSEKNPINDFKIIDNELKHYSSSLANRKQIIIANKKDQQQIFTKNLEIFTKEYPQLDVISISALLEKGLKELKFKLFNTLKSIKNIELKEVPKEVTITFEDDVIVKKPFAGMFEITGQIVKKIYDKIPLTSWENFQKFNLQLKTNGVWMHLIKKGVKNGDTIRIFDYEFEWQFGEYTDEKSK